MSESNEDTGQVRGEEASKVATSRRDFLGKAGAGAFFGVIGVGTAGLIKSLFPAVEPVPSRKFKIGPAQDYPEGTVRQFDDEKVLLFRDRAGMYAISLVCTHLACVVTYDEQKGFECPCHGSKFTKDGKVTQGPAPTALPWLEISQLPSGQLAVDASKPVPPGTKLVV